MNKIIAIILDTSGSMKDMGKIHLQRSLCRYAAQLQILDQDKYGGLDIRFYQWTQHISEITVQKDGEIPALSAAGTSSLRALSDFLSLSLNETERKTFLVLSDGNFSNLDISNFHNQLNSLSGLVIRTVAVGADADLLKLKKVSTNNSVELAENIALVIDSAIFNADEHLAGPVSIADILQTEAIEPVEAEEDWDA